MRTSATASGATEDGHAFRCIASGAADDTTTANLREYLNLNNSTLGGHYIP